MQTQDVSPQSTKGQDAKPTVPIHTHVLDTQRFDAILFDLDGVVTQTAAVHASAWKQTFDAYLAQRAEQTGDAYVPFDIDTDYRKLVDGKTRDEGVRSFLASRQITLPDGRPDDAPGRETICGLGNAKQAYFETLLEAKGIEVYRTSVVFIRQAKARGLKIAVISSSKNCRNVLEATGLTDLFEVRIDGVESERLGLAGKPEPAVFLEAAKRLGVDPPRAVVVEDALAGVQAAHQGGFAWVIAVDRVGDRAHDFRAHGANIVVPDLSAILLGDELSPETGHSDKAASLPLDIL